MASCAHKILMSFLYAIAALNYAQSVCKGDNTEYITEKAKNIINHEINSHSLFIYIYDDKIELKLRQHISQLFYSTTITKKECIEKYKIISLQKLIQKIESTINEDISPSDASYEINVITDKEINYLQFILFYKDAGNVETISFLLHVNNPTLSQQTQIINHLSTQINNLKNENKILKDQVNNLTNIVPQFGIIMWYKCDNIPSGYILCDGANDSPDLRGKFIVGGDGKHYKFNDYGGNNEHEHKINMEIEVQPHILTVDEMPSHNHNEGEYKNLLKYTGRCTVRKTDNSGGEPDLCSLSVMRNSGGNKPHKHGVVANNDKSKASNVPPYYVLCYIMKT